MSKSTTMKCDVLGGTQVVNLGPGKCNRWPLHGVQKVFSLRISDTAKHGAALQFLAQSVANMDTTSPVAKASETVPNNNHGLHQRIMSMSL